MVASTIHYPREKEATRRKWRQKGWSLTRKTSSWGTPLVASQVNKHPEGRCFPFMNHQVEPLWPKGKVVQPLSPVPVFVTSWTNRARQAPLSFTIYRSLLKFILLSRWRHPNILILFSFCLPSFLTSGSFPISRLLASDGQSIGASASASVLPVNIQGWFPLGLTGLISLLSKGLSRAFSSTTIRKHPFSDT